MRRVLAFFAEAFHNVSAFSPYLMTTLHATYRCPLCGNVVEVAAAGDGELVCCGKPMMLLRENTQEAATEKHIPVIEKLSANTILVKVGEVEHPMTAEHYIGYIEVFAGNQVLRADLNPGEKPEATFTIPEGVSEITARAWCNLHGMWKCETSTL